MIAPMQEMTEGAVARSAAGNAYALRRLAIAVRPVQGDRPETGGGREIACVTDVSAMGV
jgi:hypothetical protein